jgi:hypothetical protein
MPFDRGAGGVSFHHGIRGCTHGGTDCGCPAGGTVPCGRMSRASHGLVSRGARPSTIGIAARPSSQGPAACAKRPTCPERGRMPPPTQRPPRIRVCIRAVRDEPIPPGPDPQPPQPAPIPCRSGASILFCSLKRRHPPQSDHVVANRLSIKDCPSITGRVRSTEVSLQARLILVRMPDPDRNGPSGFRNSPPYHRFAIASGLYPSPIDG